MTRLAGKLAAKGSQVAAPVVSLALRPPLVPRRLQLGYGVDLMNERWQRDRPETVRSVAYWSAAVLPGTVTAVLGQVDTERLAVAVLDNVDLDSLVAAVLERLDVNAVANTLVTRVDLESVALSAVDQIDLTQFVRENVDLEQVVSAALAEMDLTTIVVDQVDLGKVVEAALQRVDLTEIVMQRVDLIGVAAYVVEGIDLPAIIRDSTGSVASEAVRGLRMQGVDADAAVARVVDRVLHRRGQRDNKTEEQLAPSPDDAGSTSSRR